jgi:hypothetical protein
MLADVKVIFWKNVNPDTCFSAILNAYNVILSIGRAGRMTSYTHCAVSITFETGQEVLYHVGGNSKSRWIYPKVLENWPSTKEVSLGTIDVDTMVIKSIGPIRFQLWVYFWWYLMLRWFTKWEPRNNCSMKAAEILTELGYKDILFTCIPIWLCDSLEKGVRHANNNDSGKGGGR